MNNNLLVMNSQLILIAVFVYFIALICISWLTSRKHTGNESFFRGNKRSPWYVVAIGMIGSSLSGVSFVSVPGWVRTTDMTYMQMVIGFFFGYVIIANVLLPLYYRLNLTSIYEYLKSRIGRKSYITGAMFFLLSKITGAAARLYLVIVILQTYVFDYWKIPFAITVVTTLTLVWLYTWRSGIRTIIWTDMLQALCLTAMLGVIIWHVKEKMGLDIAGMIQTIADSPHSRWFEFADWGSKQHFVKQFLSGIFVAVVMTGLDQDMMQKNLSCRNLKEAQKNMYAYGLAFTPINLMFLSLGILIVVMATRMHIVLPTAGDDILPMLCASGLLGKSILIFFTIGMISAAFSSMDSALTALTTSFCIDILGINKNDEHTAKRTRQKVHIAVSVVLMLVIMLFRAVNDKSVIDTIYTLASYTYGPLLGLYAFGLFTKYKINDKFVPIVCIVSPTLCILLDVISRIYTKHSFGYELLLINGAITFVGLFLCRELHMKGITRNWRRRSL